MGIDGPTFVPKSGYILLIWVKVCPQKLANKKSTFVLVSGFFGCCIFTILFKYYLKSRFLTKTAP